MAVKYPLKQGFTCVEDIRREFSKANFEPYKQYIIKKVIRLHDIFAEAGYMEFRGYSLEEIGDFIFEKMASRLKRMYGDSIVIKDEDGIELLKI